jgi:hypothetical protein
MGSVTIQPWPAPGVGWAVSATGKCRAQLERGMETAKPATLMQRFKNPTFGGGLAMARIDCDQTFCVSPCGLRGQ